MPECPRDPHESAASRPLSELKAALSGAQNQLQEGHVKENPQSSGSPWPRGLSDIFWQTLNHQSRQNITNFGMIACGIWGLCGNSEGSTHTQSPLPSLCSAAPPRVLSSVCQELLLELGPGITFGFGGWGKVGADRAAEEGLSLCQLQIFTWNRE